MSYLNELESELTASRYPSAHGAGGSSPSSPTICTRIRTPSSVRRTTWRDSSPMSSARRRARRVVIFAFAALAITGVALGAVLLLGTRTVLLAPGTRQVGFIPRGSTPVVTVYVLAAQVALAAGLLAVIRAWRLRRVPVITGSDAEILYRRVCTGLIAGAITAFTAPIGGISAGPGRVYVQPMGVRLVCFFMLVAMLPLALRAARLRPSRQGRSEDLRFDLGTRDPRRDAVRGWRSC